MDKRVYYTFVNSIHKKIIKLFLQETQSKSEEGTRKRKVRKE